MSQAHLLVETLKRVLKAHGLTYRDVGRALDLSEASVKRVFAENDLSLDRLDRVCRMMGMEISDLVQLMDSEGRELAQLTEPQETELASDPKLLLVAFLVVSGFSFADITTHYRVTPSEAIRCLAKLDRLGLIDLLPRNRIKLTVSPNFSWRRNGPIQRFFEANMARDFLRSHFDGAGEALYFLAGYLSDVSRANLNRRLEELATEFNTLHQQDRSVPLDRRHVCAMLLAIRPWRAHVFRDFARQAPGSV